MLPSAFWSIISIWLYQGVPQPPPMVDVGFIVEGVKKCLFQQMVGSRPTSRSGANQVRITILVEIRTFSGMCVPQFLNGYGRAPESSRLSSYWES